MGMLAAEPIFIVKHPERIRSLEADSTVINPKHLRRTHVLELQKLRSELVAHEPARIWIHIFVTRIRIGHVIFWYNRII